MQPRLATAGTAGTVVHSWGWYSGTGLGLVQWYRAVAGTVVQLFSGTGLGLVQWYSITGLGLVQWYRTGAGTGASVAVFVTIGTTGTKLRECYSREVSVRWAVEMCGVLGRAE